MKDKYNTICYTHITYWIYTLLMTLRPCYTKANDDATYIRNTQSIFSAPVPLAHILHIPSDIFYFA